jgi:hypothetical protein
MTKIKVSPAIEKPQNLPIYDILIDGADIPLRLA